MRRERLVPKLLLLLGFCLCRAASGTERACNSSLLDGGCPEAETCMLTEQQTTGVCVCLPGYNRTDDICVKTPGGADHANTQGHPWLWTLSILILIAIVIVGVYVMYKLRVVEWVRCRMSQRYNRSFDDVMIGQDDE